MHTPLRLAARRPAAVGLALALAVVLAAFAQRGVHRLVARGGATAGAEWIWTPAGTTTAPRAFLAARDFSVDSVPPGAELRVAADEEYVAWLNGRRIGSGVWTGPKVHVYPVAPLLAPGANRLVVEVRSGRGAGGLLAALVDGDGEPLLVSDERFRVFDRHEPGLVRGWLPLDDGEPAVSWGEAPTGRWGRLGRGEPRPLFAEAAGPPPRRRALRPASLETEPAEGGLPQTVTLAWEEPVVGYLTLELEPRLASVGLLALDPPGTSAGRRTRAPGPPGRDASGEERSGGAEAADREIPVVPVSGAAVWKDALPRRFGRLRLRGLDNVVGAHVQPIDPALLAPLAEPPAPVGGVFGIDRTPPLTTPAEREVWRSPLD